MSYPVGKRTKVKGQVGLYIYRAKGLADGKPKLVYYFTVGDGRYIKVGANWEGFYLEDAKIARAEYMRKLRQGEDAPIKPTQKTFGELFQIYLEYTIDTNKSYAEGDKYRFTTLKKLLGSKPANMIKTLDVERVLAHLHRKGRVASTRSAYLSCIRRFYSFLNREGFCKGDPTLWLTVKGDGASKERFLTKDEMVALVELLNSRRPTYKNKELKAQVLLGLDMGLRVSEMWSKSKRGKDDYSLRWERIDLATGKTLILGKSSKYRTLYMTPRVKAALIALGPKKYGKVFTKRYERPIRNLFDELGFNMGLEYADKDDRRRRVTPHTLRHTYATYMTMLTKNLYLVAKLLGHSDVHTTQRYAHILEDQKKEAMVKIGAFFDSIHSVKTNVIMLHPRRQ